MDNIPQILTLVACILFFAIVVLAFVYWNMTRKEKEFKENPKKALQNIKHKDEALAKEYTKLSIFDFMEFDKIEDNMVVQKNGERYLMFIRCEGINYDLMSEIEKTSVELGFVQFLNTLRFPIQIYTQTRTVNIGRSIENYSKRIDNIKNELNKKNNEYQKLIQSGNYEKKTIDYLRVEIVRLQNLLDYGQDVVSNIEKMSLNKNVLNKSYYIIISFSASELGNNMLLQEEKEQMVFSELYTRAQALIRTLFACSMKCKIMDSEEIAELLYVAYNRDESEVYTIEKAIKAGFTELYSTGQDILDKKMEVLNKQIEENALNLAQETVMQVKTEKEAKVEEKEKMFDELVKEMAENIIKENELYIGKDVAEKSVEKITKGTKKEKGGKKE